MISGKLPTAVSLSFYFFIHPPLLESLVQPSPALSSHFPENIFDGQELTSSSSVLVAGLDWTGLDSVCLKLIEIVWWAVAGLKGCHYRFPGCLFRSQI